jgi:hypothetical protein
MSTTTRTIEARLRRLEIQNRLLMALLLMLVASLLVAATGKEAIPDVVRARAFHVVAQYGTPLVKLEDSLGIAEVVGFARTITTQNGQRQR